MVDKIRVQILKTLRIRRDALIDRDVDGDRIVIYGPTTYTGTIRISELNLRWFL